MSILKDDRLAQLAATNNVARFASFGPGSPPIVRHAVLGDIDATLPMETLFALLLERSAGSVNVRSFRPGYDKGNPFHYGLDSATDVATLVRKLADAGYYTIVNETIRVDDGGVSGVALGGIIEFAPGDTPRAVEKEGAAGLPFAIGRHVLETIYGVGIDLEAGLDRRVEFSVHPEPVGLRHTHTLIWEVEDTPKVELTASITWPNRVSRFVGDKVFGLLVGDAIGLPVPATTVLSRHVKPFRFGASTGTSKTWTRTAPVEQDPGHYTTRRGFVDPFSLLSHEDPDGVAIASVLIQEGVDALHSGATLPRPENDDDYVEGVAGAGDEFMLGAQSPDSLPDQVILGVRELTAGARKYLGSVRTEWAHDGTQVWLLQLHLSAATYAHGRLSPGDAQEWLTYNVADGLDALRSTVAHAEATSSGVLVVGSVGLTSHVGDLLRRAQVPARLRPVASHVQSDVPVG